MATKKLKTAVITLISCGETMPLNAQDTADEPNATYAIDQFKREQQMSFKATNEGQEAEFYVPFHAVDHIVVTETEATVPDKPSAYGC